MHAVFKTSVVLVCSEKKHKRKESRGTHEIKVEAEDTKYKQILPTVRCAVSNLPDSDGVELTCFLLESLHYLFYI